MNPLRIEGSNIKLVGDGCLDLHALQLECPTHGRSYTTAWEPSVEEMERMRNGEPILLTIYGNSHPPVWIGVRGA